MAGVVSTTDYHPEAPEFGLTEAAHSVLSEVEPYASRGARTVPGGAPAARRAPTLRATR